MVYFYIATTLIKNNELETLNELKARAFQGGFGGPAAEAIQFRPDIPNLKLGNLDSLMFITEQMIKQEVALEALLKKIERQVEDLFLNEKPNFQINTTSGQCSIEKYIHEFKWDQNKFVGSTPLDILNSLRQRQEILDKELRAKTQIYNDIKNNAAALQKREGSLLVRDLGDVLNEKICNKKDFVNTENMATVVAVIPQDDIDKFENNYERISDNVVPSSAKQFNIESNEGLTLWRVVIYKKSLEKKNPQDEDKEEEQNSRKLKKSPVDDFIQKARDQFRFTIREFDFNPEELKKKDQQRLDFETQSRISQGNLHQTCITGYSEAFTIYIHLKRLRLIVDICMRFGLKESVCCALVKPANGKEKKVLQDLLQVFVDPSQKGLYGTKEELEEQEDFFPFVYIPLNAF